MRSGQSVVSVDRIFEPSNCRVKDQEKASVFRIIQGHFPISQKQILETYKLRPGDLSGSIKELAADGLIEQLSQLSNRGRGRPEIFFRPRNDRLVCLALYTDSWVFRGAAIDLGGNVIREAHSPVSPDEDAATLCAVQCELLESLKAELPEYTEILGVGLSLPGNVNAANRIWRDSRRWPNVRNLDYTDLEHRLGLPVVLSRDLDAALVDQLIRNPAFSDELVVLVHWGIGLGIAFSHRGMVVKSNHGRFGTFGYMQFDPGHLDHVRTPDLERLTSLRFLIDDLRQAYPNLPLDERALARVAAADSLEHIPSFRRAIEYVGLTLRNICMVFYPDRILLLSPFAENASILDRIREAFRTGRLIDDLQQHVPVNAVERGYHGCMFGATQQLFTDRLRDFLRARY